MWVARSVFVAALAALPACSEDPTAVCSGSEPVLLLRRDSIIDTYVERAGDYTFITTAALDHTIATHVGAACGVDPVPLAASLYLRPFRRHDDPADDDPTIACDHFSGLFFRIDPDGERDPTLLLPHLSCAFPVRTNHGLLLRDPQTRAIWRFPSSLEGGGARIVEDVDFAVTVWPPAVDGDELVYVRTDGVLRVHDLGTGADRRLLARVAAFEASATHILWREHTGAPVAPMRVLDRATGTNTYLGLYHEDEDKYMFGASRNGNAPPAWRFSPDDAFVLHVPSSFSDPMAAYDLAGAQVAFPQWGLPWNLGDQLIVDVGYEVWAVRPGEPPIVLDMPTAGIWLYSFRRVGDELEHNVSGELRRAPVDGSPSRPVARGVGYQWTWLDDDYLVTIDTDGNLTTIHPATTHRSVLATGVWRYSVVPGDGLYYTTGSVGSPGEVWYLPEAGLRPPPKPCPTAYVCP
jgi:hypothetical protein